MPRKKAIDDSQVATRADLLPVLRELRGIAEEVLVGDEDGARAADILGVLKKAGGDKLPVVDQRDCASKLKGWWEELFGDSSKHPVQQTPKRSLCQDAYDRGDFEQGHKLDCLRWVLWGCLQTVREPEVTGHGTEILPMARRLDLAKDALRLAQHYAGLSKEAQHHGN